jgi:hypothetical protein
MPFPNSIIHRESEQVLTQMGSVAYSLLFLNGLLSLVSMDQTGVFLLNLSDMIHITGHLLIGSVWESGYL